MSVMYGIADENLNVLAVVKDEYCGTDRLCLYNLSLPYVYFVVSRNISKEFCKLRAAVLTTLLWLVVQFVLLSKS